MFGAGETVKQGRGRGEAQACQAKQGPLRSCPIFPQTFFLDFLSARQATNATAAAVTIITRGPLCSPPSLPPSPCAVGPSSPKVSVGGRASRQEGTKV